MTAHIGTADTKAFAESTKLPIASIDTDMELSEASEVLGRLANTFDTSTWVDNTTTPNLVRKIIAMRYVGSMFLRTYPEEVDAVDNYGIWLLSQAEMLLAGLTGGSLILTEIDGDVITPTTDGSIDGYPTDASSALDPTYDDPSLGGPAFSMGKVF